MSEIRWEMMITFPTDVRATRAAGEIDRLFDVISDFFRAEGIQDWTASCSMVRDEEGNDADPEVS